MNQFNRKYSKNGSHSGFIKTESKEQKHAAVHIDEHTTIYRGFTIQRCPRDNRTFKTPYTVTCNGHYYGRDFTLAEAFRTVNKLHTEARK
ncbi:DUF4761 family protein [Citrobacter sp. FP75]|uniref:DUF4761 family protein n=1 Tax=Citrobacter sp. FP75 TaxID=1852949 RepID=UPI001BC9B1DB|nr:DUF4761 family protein [Citrobacter sp. FP75]